MDFFLAGVLILVFAGLPSFFPSVGARARGRIAFAGNLCALILCGCPAVSQLLHPVPVSLMAATSIPGLNFSLRLDCLSAIFLVSLLMISCLSSLYGVSYFGGQDSTSASWFWFNVLVASMAMVLVSANAFLFLLFWEAMALSSFFLVLHDSGGKQVREAAWIYAVASHAGLLCIMSAFFLLSPSSGGMDFDSFCGVPRTPLLSGGIFVLAICGFGAKAGFVPFHVWLPRAHPAAPSHVSALMSGVMIKLGIYGILRMVQMLGVVEAWWGILLLCAGAVSGIAGILFAIAQNDIKKLLAYSSIENIGIILIGIGLGLVSMSSGNPTAASLALAGAFMHIINHSVFKSLLFLCAGAVIKATGLHCMDEMGGLLKRMPLTGSSFLAGSAAISSIPPLNGFVGEFLILLAAFQGLLGGNGALLMSCSAFSAIVVSLVGALAMVCFVKASGTVFLGEGRTASCVSARDPGIAMLVPIVLLAFICFVLGAGSVFLLGILAGPVSVLSLGATPDLALDSLSLPAEALSMIGFCSGAFFVLVSVLLALRSLLPGAADQQLAGTWDCGYAEPSARMQYSGSSFADPTLDFFQSLLRIRRRPPKISPIFPLSSSFSMRTPDFMEESVFGRILKAMVRSSGFICRLESATVHLHILLVVLALLLLLTWSFIYG